MDGLLVRVLPYMMLLGRVSAFVAVLPIFSWQVVPMIARAGIAVLMTVFFGYILPLPQVGGAQGHWLVASVLVVGEIVIGLALGLAVNFVFQAVQQGGHMIVQQMGLAESGIIDPTTGEETETMAVFMETTFILLFLGANGHHLLLRVLGRSYQVFPPGGAPDAAALASGLVAAGSMMLLLALKLAAPALAAFLVLAVVLAIVARVLPDMNVLMESFPLRVGLGLFMAAALVPSLVDLVDEMSTWMARHLMA
jgi:flagellar biosynthetic protein FliR